MKVCLALALCLALANPVLAQRRLGRGTLPSGGAIPSSGGIAGQTPSRGTLIHFMLLEQPSVQQELRTTPDQVQRAKQLGDAQHEKLGGLSSLPREDAARKLIEVQQSADRELQAILSPEQFRRLREIGLQQMGPLALARSDVANAVGLSSDQQQKIRGLQEQLLQSAMQTMQSVQSSAGGGAGRGKLRDVKAKIAGLNDNVARLQAAKQDTEARILAMLTEEQKAKWAQQQGPRFQGQLNMGPLGGRLLGQ